MLRLGSHFKFQRWVERRLGQGWRLALNFAVLAEPKMDEEVYRIGLERVVLWRLQRCV